MNPMTPNGFIIYTMLASIFFGTALFWVIVAWLRADERARETEKALRRAEADRQPTEALESEVVDDEDRRTGQGVA